MHKKFLNSLGVFEFLVDHVSGSGINYLKYFSKTFKKNARSMQQEHKSLK